MNKSLPFFDTLLYSNIFIGICAVALVATNVLTVRESHTSDSTWFFVFFATVFTYSFFKFRQPAMPGNRSQHQQWAAENNAGAKAIQWGSLLATFVLFFLLADNAQWIVLGLALLTALYGFIPLPLAQGKKNLRDFGLVKTVFVGIVWSVTTVAIPLADTPVDSTTLIFLLIRRFLFILGLTMVFEIKDMAGDKGHLYTLPMAIGIKGTKLLAQAILFILMLVLVVQYAFYDLSLAYMLALNLSLLVSVVCIQVVNEHTAAWWYYLVLDGMMVLQLIFVFIALVYTV